MYEDEITSEQRVTSTWSDLAAFLAPVFLSFYAMAVLVQLPRTKLYRVALLPLVFWLSLRAGTCLDFSRGQPELRYFNKGLALAMFHVALRAATWTLANEPYVKRDHDRARSSNGIADKVNSKSLADNSNDIRSAMLNGCDLCYNLRGIGWNWSERTHIRSPTFKIESRLIFAVLSFGRSFLYMTIGDAMDLTPAGGSVFDPSLPPFRRYLRSTTMTFLFGYSTYANTRAVYEAISVFAVLILRQSPSRWPPLFFSPWRATSLTELWGNRWHHMNRSWMVALGTKPASRILGRVGGVLGAFALSGLMHDLGLRAAGRGCDFAAVFGFFFMMGVGVIIESAWRTMTGRLPSGIAGRLWVFTWVGLWGNRAADAWLTRGAVASGILPEPYRPSTLIWAFFTGP
ncbi:membrane bound O-acyl transferase family-domain-containing protein [Pisolithus croceorrhizus]|nr:membrane bound O-acyl transferase family-domain-containing protein [Pisolithus croceorrhizus]